MHSGSYPNSLFILTAPEWNFPLTFLPDILSDGASFFFSRKMLFGLNNVDFQTILIAVISQNTFSVQLGIGQSGRFLENSQTFDLSPPAQHPTSLSTSTLTHALMLNLCGSFVSCTRNHTYAHVRSSFIFGKFTFDKFCTYFNYSLPWISTKCIWDNKNTIV